MIAGKLVGFQLVFVHIGRLHITPPFRLEWRRTDSLSRAGGVLHLPVYSKNLRLRDMAAFAGGPSANLLCALVMLLLPPLGPFSIWFGAISMFYGMVNLIDLRRGTDGQRILKLLRNTREQERALAVLQLMVDLRKGTKPEDLEPGFLGLATAIQDNSVVTVHGHQLAYLSAYYRHDDAEAARLLEICLQHSHCDSPRLRESLFGSAVDFQANRRKRVDLARQWLSDIPEKPLTPGLRPHMEASILEGEGDIQGALKKLDEAERVVRDSPGSVEEKLILRFFCRWRKELEEKLAATA